MLREKSEGEPAFKDEKCLDSAADHNREKGLFSDSSRERGLSLDNSREKGFCSDSSREKGLSFDHSREKGLFSDSSRERGLSLDHSREKGFCSDAVQSFWFTTGSLFQRGTEIAPRAGAGECMQYLFDLLL